MRKLLLAAIIVIAFLSFLSCDSALRKVEEGNVNYYIYPYLKFTLSADRTYYIASVAKGAKISSVSVPGLLHTEFGAMPIKEFAGFEDKSDSVILEEVILDVSIEKVSDDAFDMAGNLKVVRTNGDSEAPKWAHLPLLSKEGYHFLGWKAGDEYVSNGMPIKEGADEAVPVWAPLIHHDPSDPTCTEKGSIEYWECSDCHKYFTDSLASNSVTDVSLPALGHLLPLIFVDATEATCQKDGNIAHYRCDRCKSAFSDENGNDLIESVLIPRLDHHEPDSAVYSNETHHWYQCRWCQTEMDKSEHQWGDWVITVHATENKKGSRYHDCLVCLYRVTVDIPEHDHIEGEILEKHDATCTEGAYYIEKCGNPACGEIVRFEVEDEPALGHIGYMVSFEDSTCVRPGTLQHFHCTRCGLDFANQSSVDALETTVIPMKAHEWSTSWSESDTEHYHLCKNCNEAKTDVALHVYDREVSESKYLVSSSTCQHANIYRKSCICGRPGNETFTSGVVGEHSYIEYVYKDDSFHVLACIWCHEEKPGSEENHSFVAVENGKQCSKCGYVVPYSQGGFTPVFEDKSPMGHIEQVGEEDGVFTFRFVEEKPDYPATKLAWSTDAIAQSESDGTVFRINAPYRQTYFVRCVFRNEYGVGSHTLSITGGKRT